MFMWPRVTRMKQLGSHEWFTYCVPFPPRLLSTPQHESMAQIYRRRLPRVRRAASTRETRSPVNSATFRRALKGTVAKQPLPSIFDFLTSMPCASSLMLTFVFYPLAFDL